jgi:hypothetical protein
MSSLKKNTAFVLIFAAIELGASNVHAPTATPAAMNAVAQDKAGAPKTSTLNSCFAICADSSHGSTGWSGPVRTGPTAQDKAQEDADAHNKKNPGHDASTSC